MKAPPACLNLIALVVNVGVCVPTSVCDQETEVGGLAKAVVDKRFRLDIGSHRFFTEVSTVRDLWHELPTARIAVRNVVGEHHGLRTIHA